MYTQFTLLLIAEDLRNNRDKLPEDLSRFESHLRQPVRMHNIREKMQKSGKLTNIVIEKTAEVVNENGINVDPINIYAKTQHVFAEVLLLTFFIIV